MEVKACQVPLSTNYYQVFKAQASRWIILTGPGGLVFISFRGENNQLVPYFSVALGKVCGIKHVLCSLEGASWALGLEGSQGAP